MVREDGKKTVRTDDRRRQDGHPSQDDHRTPGNRLVDPMRQGFLLRDHVLVSTGEPWWYIWLVKWWWEPSADFFAWVKRMIWRTMKWGNPLRPQHPP